MDKLPIGQWVAAGVSQLTEHAAGGVAFFSDGLESAVQAMTRVLVACPPLLLLFIATFLIYRLRRSWGLTLFSAFALILIDNLAYREATLQTLVQVALASAICMLIGVPLGIAAAHRPWVYRVLHPLLDLMQTIPTFVYLIPTLMLFGLGIVPAMVSTIIFALPAPVRLTYLGLRDIPPPLLEAAKAFGYSPLARLWRVELPAAMPGIAAGLTQCIMLSLSMVVIAALVGAEGLGQPVVRALNTADMALGFEAGLAIVLLAIMLDRLCQSNSLSREQR
ncbi:ABC transporter permease [Iodobacter fluviatilis]|uniref:Glycine betaine/L-proline transport system permease protein proW n=1 Tax=Iodobacter fluviatilis TaxID=537 RepID=A0A377Q2R8_9NEIS|nr:ABC transporter permease subunit [Iodobacter fluviatilis]TCU90031.1 glycine betaine/proline transport system permease protein [Iodobacter fluviatilis]STQ89058.1 Glycine betaine/L-proline transport system permease protein proW [Iodobacter fluviatilis]